MSHLEATRLSELIPPHDWELCRPVVRDINEAGIPYAVGGGLAFSFYSRRGRNTKDLDLLVRPGDVEAATAILRRHGFIDYFDQEPYDRSWITRGYRDGVIIDIIWTLPNHRFEVDDDWFKRSRESEIHGQPVKLVTMEDLIRVKLYVLQRGRTDWPDIMNVLYTQAEHIQWRTLTCLLGDDVPLLSGLLQVYAWLEPVGAARIPAEVWARLGMRVPDPGPVDEDRKFLLDTRDWFGPFEEVASC